MQHMMVYDRLQFAMTVTFHYLFPQLTMGLALFLVYFKSRAVWRRRRTLQRSDSLLVEDLCHHLRLRRGHRHPHGVPVRHQLGAGSREYAGGVIGQTLAMEGAFAFFLESTFLGIVLFGEKRLGQRVHWFATFMLFVGTWLSAYFIIATNAWMQHPVAYEQTAGGQVTVNSLWGLADQPLDPVAIPAQYERCGGHDVLRGGRRGRLLPAVGQESGPRPEPFCAPAWWPPPSAAC